MTINGLTVYLSFRWGIKHDIDFIAASFVRKVSEWYGRVPFEK